MTSHDTKKAGIMTIMSAGPGVCLLQCGDVSSQKITGCSVSGRGKRGTHTSSERLLRKSHLQVMKDCRLSLGGYSLLKCNTSPRVWHTKDSIKFILTAKTEFDNIKNKGFEELQCYKKQVKCRARWLKNFKQLCWTLRFIELNIIKRKNCVTHNKIEIPVSSIFH